MFLYEFDSVLRRFYAGELPFLVLKSLLSGNFLRQLLKRH
jgi:hypothetical protein